MNISTQAIASFLRSRADRPRWIPVPLELRPRNIDEGYRIQRAVHEAIERNGGRLVGYKVASISPAGQRSYGITEPLYAGMFTDNQAPDLATALSAPLISPSLECEIAFRLKSDIDGSNPHLSLQDLAEAVDSCHIACEVVDNRYGEPLAIGVPTLLADDFFHASFVLGEANPLWRGLDLTNLDAAIEIDGIVTQGISADVLDALSSLHWLVRALAGRGLSLSTGNIVMTGSIVTPMPISLPARSVSLSISGFDPLNIEMSR
jgi:2-keto-4-pentenoate hydratase